MWVIKRKSSSIYYLDIYYLFTKVPIIGHTSPLCQQGKDHLALDSTVVDLSTRSAFSIIFHFFQIQKFIVLQQSFSYKKIFLKQEKRILIILVTKNDNFWQFFFKCHYIKSTFYNPKQLVNGLCHVIYLLEKKSLF
jgi:hypothetical protein